MRSNWERTTWGESVGCDAEDAATLSSFWSQNTPKTGVKHGANFAPRRKIAENPKCTLIGRGRYDAHWSIWLLAVVATAAASCVAVTTFTRSSRRRSWTLGRQNAVRRRVTTLQHVHNGDAKPLS